MTIAQIGQRISSIGQIPYISDRTFLDYDVLIFEFPYVISGYPQQSKQAIEKRVTSLQQFLQFKKVPFIIFTPEPADWHQGTIHGQVGFHYFIPIPPIAVETEHGTNFTVNANTFFTDFLRKYQECFHYQSYFTQKTGTTIAETLHTKRPIAFYNDVSIFLPPLKKLPPQQDLFLKDLVEVAEKVKAQKIQTQLPDWTTKYFLPNEKDRVDHIKYMQEKLDEIQEQLGIQKQVLSEQQQKKRLFTATGKELEKAIEEICKELGLEVLESEENRDDLIIRFNDKIAVMEIKGVTGTAAEKHASQLEKWVSSYHEQNGLFPKAILIVNGYKDIQLNERSSEVFPNQMLPYSERRDHCLISTLQLLGLYFEAQMHPEKKNELIESLFTTVGVYQDFKNWTGFIEIDNTQI